MKSNWSLKTRLIGAFLLAGSLPMISIGVYSSIQASKSIKNEITEKMNAVRGTKADSIIATFNLSKTMS